MMALLDQEQSALRGADLPRLERLMPRKVALLQRIETANRGAPREEIQRLKDRAARNARLFEALIAGVRDARDLIARARDMGRGRTYGRDGARLALDPPSGSLHRRA